MNRYVIGSLWDRNNRNGTNKNFEYLFEGRHKIDELNYRADGILNEAKKTNDMNESVQQQINTLIAESGTSDAEVLQARIDAEGNEYAVLKERLDEKEQNFSAQLAQIEEQKVDGQFKSLIVFVPSSYPDIQTAITEVSKLKINSGANIDIILESGYMIPEGIFLENGDYSHIRLSSQDDVVIVTDDFTGNFLHAINASLPIFNILLDMRDKGDYGYSIIDNSRGYIMKEKGIINAGGTGLYLRSSFVRAAWSNFSGANNRSAWFTRGSVGSVAASNLSYCKGGETALYVSRGSTVDASEADISHANTTISAVHCLRSKLSLIDANLSNSNAHGVVALQGSEVALRESDVRNAKKNAVFAEFSSSVSLSSGTDVSNAGENGLFANKSSKISGDGVIANNCGINAALSKGVSEIDCPGIVTDGCRQSGLRAEEGSTINAPNAMISKVVNNGLLVLSGATINAGGISITECGSHGVSASGVSTVNIPNNSISQNGGYGVTATEGTRANLRNGSIKSNGQLDIHQTHGATIIASGCATTQGVNNPIIGDCSVDSFNTLSSRGILFGS